MFNIHIKSISWLFFEKVLRAASGILITAMVARYLGPSHFGFLSVAIGTIAVFSASVSMGADHINVSELSKRQDLDALKFLSSAVLIRFLWSSFSLLCIFLYIEFTQEENVEVYFILATLIPLAAFSIFGNKLQSDGAFKQYSLLNIAIIFFAAISRIAGVHFSLALEFFALVAVFEGILASIFFAVWIFKNNKYDFKYLYPSWENMKSYFLLCLPTAASAVLVTLYLRLEIFMVKYQMGNASAGLWAAVVMFITPWGMVAASILPVANRYLSKGDMEGVGYEKKLVLLIRFMMIVSFIFVLLTCVASAFLVPVLFGESYLKIIEAIWIASIVIIPLFMGSVQEIWIAQQQNTGVVIKKVLVGLPVSAVLLFWFIEAWGLYGAAVAMVMSYVLTAIILNYMFDKKFLKLQIHAVGIKYE